MSQTGVLYDVNDEPSREWKLDKLDKPLYPSQQPPLSLFQLSDEFYPCNNIPVVSQNSSDNVTSHACMEATLSQPTLAFIAPSIE
ncbi:hypothetical protein J6590_099802 [Homalodisca vitripennis]|nr:hypothetical protein J6590_099802 [Homalodisca vitripennis]